MRPVRTSIRRAAPLVRRPSAGPEPVSRSAARPVRRSPRRGLLLSGALAVVTAAALVIGYFATHASGNHGRLAGGAPAVPASALAASHHSASDPPSSHPASGHPVGGDPGARPRRDRAAQRLQPGRAETPARPVDPAGGRPGRRLPGSRRVVHLTSPATAGGRSGSTRRSRVRRSSGARIRVTCPAGGLGHAHAGVPRPFGLIEFPNGPWYLSPGSTEPMPRSPSRMQPEKPAA